MDGQRFDDLTRKLVRGRLTRRRLLKGLAGGAAAGVAGGAAALGPAPDAAATGCKGLGQTCLLGGQCCSGFCLLVGVPPLRLLQCVCPPGKTACNGACVDLQSDPANCGACGQSCGGQCVAGECRCSELVLSGGPDPATPIEIDDDLTVYLNGTPIFEDTNGVQNFWPPIPVPGGFGDQLRVVGIDVQGAEWAISPLYLHCPALGTVQVLDPNGFRICCNQPVGGDFYDQTFTIAL